MTLGDTMASRFLEAFLDGFAMSGAFGWTDQPGSATQAFATDECPELAYPIDIPSILQEEERRISGASEPRP